MEQYYHRPSFNEQIIAEVGDIQLVNENFTAAEVNHLNAMPIHAEACCSDSWNDQVGSKSRWYPRPILYTSALHRALGLVLDTSVGLAAGLTSGAAIFLVI